MIYSDPVYVGMRDSVFKYDYEVVPEDVYRCYNTTLWLCGGSDACEGGKWNTDDFTK